MHVGLFVTASQEHTVRPSNSFGAESGGGERERRVTRPVLPVGRSPQIRAGILTDGRK